MTHFEREIILYDSLRQYELDQVIRVLLSPIKRTPLS